MEFNAMLAGLQAVVLVGFLLSIVVAGMLLWRAAHTGWRNPYHAVLVLVVFTVSLVNAAIFSDAVAAMLDGTDGLDLRGDTPVLLRSMEGTHVKFLDGLRVVTNREPDIFSLSKFSSGYVGLYNPLERKITMREGQESIFVFQHEVMHHVWHRQLLEAEREQWRVLHEFAETFPTNYSRTDAAEDFADSGALYFLGERDVLDEERLAYFTDICLRLLENGAYC